MSVLIGTQLQTTESKAQSLNFASQNFFSLSQMRRIDNAADGMDGEFKVPLPKGIYQNVSSVLYPQNLTNQQFVASQIAKKREQQKKQAFLMAQKVKFQMLKQKQNRKKNSYLFIMRMKYLAQLPENQNAKFHIPVTLIQYGNSLLSLEQIDQFIQHNNLIERPLLTVNKMNIGNQNDLCVSSENKQNVSVTDNQNMKEDYIQNEEQLQEKQGLYYNDDRSTASSNSDLSDEDLGCISPTLIRLDSSEESCQSNRINKTRKVASKTKRITKQKLTGKKSQSASKVTEGPFKLFKTIHVSL